MNLHERDIYIMKVDGAWGGYMPRPKFSMTFNAEKGVELKDFVQSLAEELGEMRIKPHFKCIENEGVYEQIRKCQIAINRSR